jgi:filamentous hemagglutinin
LPNEGRIRYVPPENYHASTPFPRGPQHGYLDRFDNEWIWDPVKGEWDVQLSRTGKAHLGWLSNSGNHVNISPTGQVTH